MRILGCVVILLALEAVGAFVWGTATSRADVPSYNLHGLSEVKKFEYHASLGRRTLLDASGSPSADPGGIPHFSSHRSYIRRYVVLFSLSYCKLFLALVVQDRRSHTETREKTISWLVDILDFVYAF
jgi:hypothetical protein